MTEREIEIIRQLCAVCFDMAWGLQSALGTDLTKHIGERLAAIDADRKTIAGESA